MSARGPIEQLHKAYRAKKPEETTRIYDDWATDYDAHMEEAGYCHPAMVAAMLSRNMNPGDQKILDAGAGTGIMGEILSALGYGNLTGLDASRRMLERAAKKGKYRDLRQLRLGHALDFADGRFAAVVAAGVFTPGHAPLSGLDELIRVTRTDGLLVFSVARDYLQGPFRDKRQALEEQRLWRFVDASGKYNSAPLRDTLISQVFAFRAC